MRKSYERPSGSSTKMATGERNKTESLNVRYILQYNVGIRTANILACLISYSISDKLRGVLFTLMALIFTIYDYVVRL